MYAARQQALDSTLDVMDSHTNRDLYQFVEALRWRNGERQRPLEEYLRALWFLGARYRGTDSLSFGQFTGLLEDAMHAAPPPFAAAWWKRISRCPPPQSAFSRWERTLISQVVALQRIEEAGMPSEGLRGRGVDAAWPASRSRWYNLAPLEFLECAVVETVGGGGRRGIHARVVGLDRVGWTLFGEFLIAGQGRG